MIEHHCTPKLRVVDGRVQEFPCPVCGLITALAHERAARQQAERVAVGEVWHWMGDGTDDLPSLTCPVLIQPEQLRALVEERDRLTAQGAIVWQRIADAHPAPHARYLVCRERVAFVATPCYGLHVPWWVPSGAMGELDPVGFQPEDLWCPLTALAPSLC